MRTVLLAACLACLAAPLPAAAAGEAPQPAAPAKPSFVNFKVSSRAVALNQPVRIEFTTMPRQVDGVDVATAVGNALRVGTAGTLWRPLSPAKVVEHEKTKTVTVTVSLAARRTGEIALPSIPLPWLANEQVVEPGLVTVSDRLLVGSESRPLPKEVEGVAGFGWAMPLEEARARLGETRREGDAVVAEPAPGLQLVFRGGILAEARLAVAGLDLPRARDSFLDRWGGPLIAEADATGADARLTWILGWTRIDAEPAADGIALRLTREDLEARLTRAAVGQRVFDVLEGPQEAPAEVDDEAARERRAQEAEAEFRRPAVTAPE